MMKSLVVYRIRWTAAPRSLKTNHSAKVGLPIQTDIAPMESSIQRLSPVRSGRERTGAVRSAPSSPTARPLALGKAIRSPLRLPNPCWSSLRGETHKVGVIGTIAALAVGAAVPGVKKVVLSGGVSVSRGRRSWRGLNPDVLQTTP